MDWKNCRIVAFDTETTGLQSYNGDRIIEFGAVELRVDENGQVTDVREFPFLINPERLIPRESSNVCGIYDKDVADKPIFSAVADEIWDILNDAILVAHNFNFDFGFIRNEFRRLEDGREWPKTRGEFDTLTLARIYMSELKSKRLESVAEKLNVPLINAHRAVDDAEACGRVFIAMAQRYNAPDDLEGLLEWGAGVGAPPVNSHIGVRDRGMPEFLDGEYEGELIELHPLHLQWMFLAKELNDGEWFFKYPEPLRLWIDRWLRGRASGSPKSSLRSFGAKDWAIDPAPWVQKTAQSNG